MKAVSLFFLTLFLYMAVPAQRCAGIEYGQQRMQRNPLLAASIESIIQFQQNNQLTSRIEGTIIKIPVVVHNLYHNPSEKISDAQVNSQLAALNACYRRRNADTVNTPAYFKALGADCEIEFQLATADPRRRYTNGIVRKYTPITKWEADDQVKFASSMGDDAWDPKSYLNIWVCNLDRLAGYSSVIGDSLNRDGIVINLNAFGLTSNNDGYNLGKTAVHEVGHWLNLTHIWGDTYCGDDSVDDTPKQAGYNMGCPSGIRSTCGNTPTGDMYMNFMDFTSDVCMNLFTRGQKLRMRALFEPGGLRYGMLSSKGLSAPLIFESPYPMQIRSGCDPISIPIRPNTR
ncbi:MAG: zinc metalloprotease [Chitinophagaceae bacterium]|nr:zinc metalloprotease [Chitinophagaceae bacterium]